MAAGISAGGQHGMPFGAFDAPAWRLLPGRAADPDGPARAPRGRFHAPGQWAAYASLSAEGAGVAVARYLGDGAARLLVPVRLVAARVADLRGVPAASAVWQEEEPPSTWALADAARAAGADAMLYSSRSRPDLTHAVAFRAGCFRAAGPAVAWAPPGVQPGSA